MGVARISDDRKTEGRQQRGCIMQTLWEKNQGEGELDEWTVDGRGVGNKVNR